MFPTMTYRPLTAFASFPQCLQIKGISIHKSLHVPVYGQTAEILTPFLMGKKPLETFV